MIYQKDVIEGLDELQSDYADVILIDPPYNIGKDFGVYKDKMSLDAYIKWSDRWIDECHRVLKDSGTVYIYGFSEILAHVSARLIFDHRWLIWNYVNKAVPRMGFWQRSHESILCCWKNEKKRIFNLDAVREPYTDVFLKNAAGKVRKSTKGRFSHGDKETVYQANEHGALPRDVFKIESEQDSQEEYLICKRMSDKTINVIAPLPNAEAAIKLAADPRDVIKVSALAGGAGAAERWFLCKTCNEVYHNRMIQEHKDHEMVHHPTQKPYELTRKLLVAAKPESDGMVVIPFIGSGAECAVAEDLGMKWVGFEINEDYVKLANGFLKKRN